MKKKILVLLGVLTISTMVLMACGGSEDESSSAGEGTHNDSAVASAQEKAEKESANGGTDGESTDEEKLLGDFEAVTLGGDSISQDIFAEADLTMVNMWGTFCGPCINEMPDLGEISKEYADKGVQLVGIITDVTETGDETAKKIIEQTGADYTHIVLNQALYDNYLDQVQVVPTTVFLDKDGKQVGEVYTGSRDREAWTVIIEALLKEI